MPDRRTPDVVVIGASAAGLAASVSAARAGADVLLLEAKDTIGVPPSPAVVGFDHLWPATVPRPAASVRRRLAGARLRGPSGRGPLVEAPASLLDRAVFDAALARDAEAAGAQVIAGVTPLEVTPARIVRAPGLEAHPRVILFADGAASLAARFVRATRDPARLAWGAILEVDAPEDDDRITITLGAHARGGRSQLNPLGDGRWSHWTFFRGSPSEAEARARRALALDARLQGWPAKVAEAARFRGVAPDPVYTLPGELSAPGVLVAGGAAGQAGLEAGLAAGWLAGETAARAARDGASLGEYARLWRPQGQRGYRLLRGVTDALARLRDPELDALLGAWAGERLHLEDLAALASPARGAGVAWRVLRANPRGAVALAAAAGRAGMRRATG